MWKEASALASKFNDSYSIYENIPEMQPPKFLIEKIELVIDSGLFN